MADDLAQEDEILAIQSIYEEEGLLSFNSDEKCGKFYVKITSQESTFFNLNFIKENSSIKVSHLPPILIEFVFPENYPSVNPPQFTLNCRWLSKKNLIQVCEKLDELWLENDNQCVMFTWISFLSNDIFEYLNIDINNMKITKETDDKNLKLDKRAVIRPCSHLLIRDYDKDQIELKFQTSYFTCQVCFEDKSGRDCMKFHECNHVFCNECMKGYFECQISNGDVQKLTCPYDKCETQALQSQVTNLVGIEMFNRYDGLLLRDCLNSMSDIIYCPRVNCQSPVIPEETLAQCNAPNCNYVFCALCRKGYHGVEPCQITNSEMKRICTEYAQSNQEQQELMHKKYGEKRIKQAIEETSSMELIRNTSKQCPKCRSWMQKSDGCNKMTCFKCNSFFCWLCLNILSRNDPYSHFNSSRSECFEKLFEGTWVNDPEEPENRNEEFPEELAALDNPEDFLYEQNLDGDEDEDDGIVFAY